MSSRLIAASLAALTAAAAPTVVSAQDRDDHWNGDNNNGWDPADHYHGGHYRERRLGRDDRGCRGHDGRYHCRRGGGVLGSAIG